MGCCTADEDWPQSGPIKMRLAADPVMRASVTLLSSLSATVAASGERCAQVQSSLFNAG
jgi:hypothetical protein